MNSGEDSEEDDSPIVQEDSILNQKSVIFTSTEFDPMLSSPTDYPENQFEEDDAEKDWDSEDLEDGADDEERRRRQEQQLRKKEKIKMQMRLRRESTFVKPKDPKDKKEEKERRKEMKEREREQKEREREQKEREKERENDKDTIGRKGSNEAKEAKEGVPTLPRLGAPDHHHHHHLSMVAEKSGSEVNFKGVVRLSGTLEHIEMQEPHLPEENEPPRHGILKSREPSTVKQDTLKQEKQEKQDTLKQDNHEKQDKHEKHEKHEKPEKKKRKGDSHDGNEQDTESDGRSHEGQAPVRSESFVVKNVKKSSKQEEPNPMGTIRPGPPANRTMSRGITSMALTSPEGTLKKQGSFMVDRAPTTKKRKGVLDHLIFAGRSHMPHHHPIATPVISTPVTVDNSPFPATPPPALPKEKLEKLEKLATEENRPPKASLVTSASILSIPASDIENALARTKTQTLPRSPNESEFIPDVPTHAEISIMKRSDSQSTEIEEGDLGMREDLAEDYSGSDRTYISDSEDFQYVRLNIPKAGQTLTEDLLKELTQQLALSSKEVNSLPNDCFALRKYLESLPKNIVVDLVEDGGEWDLEVEQVHTARILHHTPKAPWTMFRPPDQIRHQEGDHGERSATWLELFYDIFYVAVFSKISHTHLESFDEYGTYISLFVPIWWAWAMVTFYATRFDTDDVLHRLLIFVQMFGITGLAVTVHNAYDADAVGFIWSFVVIRACLVLQYSIVFFFMPKMRKSILYYLFSNLFSVFAFGISVLCPMPYRLLIWYGSFVIEWLVDFIKFKKVPFNGSHLPERFGLFTIIVLGEAVLQIVDALSKNATSDINNWIITGIGIAICFCLWWVYFNDFTGEVLKDKTSLSNGWLYIHLPLHMFHTLFGALLSSILSVHEHGISSTLSRIFFLNNSLIFACNSLLKVALAVSEYRDEKGITHDFIFAAAAALSRFVFSIVLLLCFLIPEEHNTPLVLMGVMLGCCIAQVVIDISLQMVENSYLHELELEWEQQHPGDHELGEHEHEHEHEHDDEPLHEKSAPQIGSGLLRKMSKRSQGNRGDYF